MYVGKAVINCYTSWIVAYCDEGIMDYYYWWYHKTKGVKLATPMHGSHISIVRGGEDGIEHGWWRRNADDADATKTVVEFNYSNDMQSNDSHVWLPVWGEELTRIRTDLDLSEKPFFDFHLTLGRFPWY